ncbi:hypothetical protein [Ferrimonas senticii]|uniref:hypothetical protein n=1 Tax=Ferrimonas senticii TaxID=394566 RepID=UPI00040A5A14|nr:hypothetical protein [Ferrimonas senticii]
MTKKKGKTIMVTPDKQTIATKLIASIICLEDLYVLLNKKGRTLSYTRLTDKEGKTKADADACTQDICDSNVMMNLGNSCWVDSGAIEAIENHNGKEFKGLIFRGEDDAILNYLTVESTEARDELALKFNAALESYYAGKFQQPELAVVFN